jgi:hypothetical protein
VKQKRNKGKENKKSSIEKKVDLGREALFGDSKFVFYSAETEQDGSSLCQQ